MAKPICVIYYNPEMAGSPNGEKINMVEMNKAMEIKFPDYHVFALPSYASLEGNAEDIRFEVFNSDKEQDISIEEFKNHILETLSGKTV